MEIKKHHVYTADLNPGFGTEPGKRRPVVVVQTNLLNNVQHPSTLICPITIKVLAESQWLRVHLQKDEAGLAEASDILVDQVRAIDNRRLKKRIGDLHRASRIRLAASLRALFDL